VKRAQPLEKGPTDNGALKGRQDASPRVLSSNSTSLKRNRSTYSSSNVCLRWCWSWKKRCG